MELHVSKTKCCTLSDTTEASVINMVAGLDIQACLLDWDTFYVHACHFKWKVWHFGKIHLLAFFVCFLSESQMRKLTDKNTDSSWLAFAPFCGGTARNSNRKNGCKSVPVTLTPKLLTYKPCLFCFQNAGMLNSHTWTASCRCSLVQYKKNKGNVKKSLCCSSIVQSVCKKVLFI